MIERGVEPARVELLRRMEAFVRENHRAEGGHDASHVLAVTDYAIRVAREVDAPVDPFILVAGALFHDLGRIGAETALLHGLRGAALARTFLESTEVDGPELEAILRIVARHTPTTGIPPETVEERIVYDADALDRLGLMGMLRGLIGKRGSTGFIIEDRIQKRLGDYDRLHFDVSRRIGEALHRETLEVVSRFRAALTDEGRRLACLSWPVEDGVEMSIPSVREAAVREESEGETDDLAAGMARVEPLAAMEPDARAPAAGFTRSLSEREVRLIGDVARFVEENHAHRKAHDYAHVLTVVDYALRIARSTEEDVDPTVTILGAFLHDIGRAGGGEDGAMHGLRGAAVAGEYLSSTWLPEASRRKVEEVVVRHTLTSGLEPRSVEERVVFDADGLAGLGLLGALRGIIGGVGSMEEIVEACLRYAGKRQDRLHFDASRRIAGRLESEGRDMIRRFRSALDRRVERTERLELPDEMGAHA